MLNKNRCPVCGHATHSLYYKDYCRHAVDGDKRYSPVLHAERRAANIAAGWLPDDGRDAERRHLYEKMAALPPGIEYGDARGKLSVQLPL